jgi:hypothetical protein
MKKNTNNKITVAFEDITPEIAKRYLARNLANRNLRESTVRAYEIDMRAGNWVVTHQGVAFNDRGDLIDGQYTLTAIVRSGVTVKLLVTRGLPTEQGNTKTMDVIDRGAVRSVADQPIRSGAAQAKTKVSEGLATRFVKSAKDIGGITPEAEALIARVDNKERYLGKSRLDYMRNRVKSGALEG